MLPLLISFSKTLCYGTENLEPGEGVWLRSCGSAKQ